MHMYDTSSSLYQSMWFLKLKGSIASRTLPLELVSDAKYATFILIL